MLDLFTIFSKGGIVLWCFQNTPSGIFTSSVNALIRSVILQERTGGNNTFDHNNLLLQFKLDNEFELVFVVAYQKILQLSYVDKFLNDVHLEFRDKYKNELLNSSSSSNNNSALYNGPIEFQHSFQRVLSTAEQWAKTQAKIPKQMRTFDESLKSKKTVASMIERKQQTTNEQQQQTKKGVAFVADNQQQHSITKSTATQQENNNDDDAAILLNRLKFAQKMNKNKKVGGGVAAADKPKSPKSPPAEKAGKKPRIWELSGNTKDLASLERTTDKPLHHDDDDDDDTIQNNYTPNTEIIGKMQGGIKDIEIESSDEDGDEPIPNQQQQRRKEKSGGKLFSMFRSLVGSKSITSANMEPVLDKFRDHLIGKNVATDIAAKLCESVATKLEGKVLGTFETISATIRQTLIDSLVQILSPKRRVDILRDCLETRNDAKRRPYTMVFCGVNGVGKSTNLAKICFWLIENNFRVLIAACDTFRAGAVEQLRTHTRHLNALHPADRHGGLQMVQLYEKGYGKDAAGIAMEAIRFAHDAAIDVVLIDTAGRMQDNEPLMRALAKLININEPDLVLFVGEALVGNEAIDQLVKFNQALADYSSASTTPHLIDGIVLTKFDTIDDKVGAAISMTYITGQPIVFVGTGQTYTDLKALNTKAVVHSLMK